MTINGFTVRYSDGIKTADYAPPRIVDLTANVVVENEDAEGALTKALDMLRRTAHAYIHGVPVAHAEAVASPEPVAPTGRRGRPPKAKDEAPAGPQPSGDAGDVQTSANPASMDDVGESSPPTSSDSQASAVDVAEVEEWEVGPAEVTDADLNNAVQRKNAELNDPPRIRSLIQAYNPDPQKPFQLRQMAQERRQDFLDKLGALKKA